MKKNLSLKIENIINDAKIKDNINFVIETMIETWPEFEYVKKPSDIEEIKTYYKDFFNRTMKAPHHQMLLAKHAGQIVGVSWYSFNPYLKQFGGLCRHAWVHPNYRREGIATKMRKLGHQWLLANEIYRCWSTTSINNNAIINMNTKFNYKLVGQKWQLIL